MSRRWEGQRRRTGDDPAVAVSAGWTSPTSRFRDQEGRMMGFWDFFEKKQSGAPDPLKDLVLSKLRVGYLVDFDLQTWQVTAHSRYDFGEGCRSEEWQLTSGRTVRYLEREDDDDVEWSWSQKIPIGAIDGDVGRHIIDHDDPPSRLVFKGKTYYLEESGPARMYEGGGGTPKEFVYWDFIDEGDGQFLTIEQWGETDFEAAFGQTVEEYQFTNILPGGES
ncbi:MAG: DUF4178 domain-containing protein [Acidobacteriota bacterium]